MHFQEEILDERTLMKGKKVRPSGTMDMRGSEGAARKDVSRAGFRKKGPVQEPKVEKSGKDVPVWVRTHKSPAEYAAHSAKKKHREGEKHGSKDSKELKKQFHKTGAKKDSPVHDITVGSPKRSIKDSGQKARAFVSALKDTKEKMKSKKGVATNTPTAIHSTGKKRKRSDEEGAEQRGRIYKKLGMGERNPKTGVQMAKLSDSFNLKTFDQFIFEAKTIRSKEDAEKMRQTKDNPDEWRVRNKGGGHHGLNRVSALRGQGKRRSENLKALSKKELEDHAKRNLYPNPSKTANKALKKEREVKKQQRTDAQTKSKQTGHQHDVDHIEAQPNRRSEKLRSRFQAIHPGDSAANRRVIPQKDNLSKNSKSTGEKKTTRSGAIRAALNRIRK